MTPRKTVLAQLAEREQQVATAQTKAIEIEDQAKRASAEADRLRELVIEAYATDDQAQVEKLTRAKAKADARAAEPWPERIAGAERAAARVQAEADAWRTEHVQQLLDEVSPSAHDAAEAVRTAVAALEEARQTWHQTADRVASLVRGSIHPRAMPSFDRVDAAVRELRHTVGDNIPAPLPGELSAARVLPMHDSDPAVREPARAAITEQAG